jgi:putative sigma-54 modulation protein
MNLNITARHLDLTPALSEYVRKKVEKAERYLDPIIWAQAILAVEKHRHIAEVIVHTPGNTFRTKGESTDLYAAIDMAAHKLDVHLSRVKDRKRGHHIKEAEAMAQAQASIPAGTEAAQGETDAIAEVNTVALEPMSLKKAVRALHSNPLPFLIFVNERSNQISVIYKKGKGSYGLVEAVE